MKKVFITIPWFQPAYKAGGPIQSIANMVATLNTGYHFYIFCGNTDLNNDLLSNIETGQWIQYNDYTKVWYAKNENRSKILTEEIGKIQPAVVFSIGIFSWHFNIVPLLFGKGGRKILSVRGMLHPAALEQKKRKKQFFLRAMKAIGFQRKNIFHATDDAEKAYIQKVFGEEAKVKIAGNFPHFFAPGRRQEKQKWSLKLITVALISPMKNHLLILQALENCTASIQYEIYGPVKDMEYWQACLHQIKKLPPNIQVNYNGDIQPKQVEFELQQAEVFILPSKSENFGHAFIEALSAGLPVITSMYTPWNELEENKAGINTASTAEALAKAISFFAEMDDTEFSECSVSAHQYAIKAIDLNGLNKAYNELFS